MSFLFVGSTFAITQSVNEVNGVNYGLIAKDCVYKKWSTYYLSIDYVQYFNWYEAALARAEDGIIFWDLSTDFNQNFPSSYYTTKSDWQRVATSTTKKKITTYLKKIGEKWYDSLIKKMNSNYIGTVSSRDIFNGLTEMERMIVWPSFDPNGGRWGTYIRNTSTKVRNIPFSKDAKITIEWSSMSLSQVYTWAQNPTQVFAKVYLQKGKILWFRVEYHP